MPGTRELNLYRVQTNSAACVQPSSLTTRKQNLYRVQLGSDACVQKIILKSAQEIFKTKRRAEQGSQNIYRVQLVYSLTQLPGTREPKSLSCTDQLSCLCTDAHTGLSSQDYSRNAQEIFKTKRKRNKGALSENFA